MRPPHLLLVAVATLATTCATGPGDEATRQGDVADPGVDIFNTQCALCHGRDGRLGLNGSKDLTRSTLTREEVIAVVTQGKGAMMPYKMVLTGTEINAVVDHVFTLRHAR